MFSVDHIEIRTRCVHCTHLSLSATRHYADSISQNNYSYHIDGSTGRSKCVAKLYNHLMAIAQTVTITWQDALHTSACCGPFYRCVWSLKNINSKNSLHARVAVLELVWVDEWVQQFFFFSALLFETTFKILIN